MSLAIDVLNPGTIYAGTVGGGVFKSADGGDSWSAVNAGLTGSTVKALLVDPVIPNIVYAGTSTDGVFKSADGGGNWTAVNMGLTSAAIACLAVDPQASATVYAGTSEQGIFKSTDGGNNWSAANTRLIAARVTAVAVDPMFPATVYAATSYSGIFKSDDGGSSWSAINNGLLSNPSIFSVTALAVDPQTSTIYAGTGRTGVFKSTDRGSSWNAVNNGITDLTISAVVVDPQTPTTIYASSGGLPPSVFKSTNGGGSWIRAATPGASEVATLAIDPQAPPIVYAGTYSGLFKSTDGAVSWSKLLQPRVTVVAIDPRDSNTLFAYTPCCQGAAILKSTDGGASWIAASAGLPNISVFDLAIDPQTPATVYAATYGGGVFRTTDGAVSWSAVNAGLTKPFAMALAIDGQSPSTIYAGTNGGAFATSITPSFTLTIGRTGAGSGTITSSPPGIDCGTDCSESYLLGTTVTLTAAPDAGSRFAGWSGCDAVAGTSCTVMVTAATSVSANFDLKTFVLSVRTSGLGTGTVTSSPPGIDCGADCAEAYVSGTNVTLTATPAPGSIFTGWSSCDSASGADCNLTVTSTRSVTARFLGVPLPAQPRPPVLRR